jgi:uncharacterized membrane protein
MKKIIMSVLAILSVSQAAFAVDMKCGGTEPFWGASVAGNTLTFTAPNQPKPIKLKILSTRQAAGMSENTVLVAKTKYSTLTLVAGPCSDGMSDETYTHHAVYDINGTVMYGCCNLTK